MSSDQPPEAGGPQDEDPFRKGPPREPPPNAPFGGGSDDPFGGGFHGHEPFGGGPYDTPDPLAGMPPLANRGRRLLARIIDSLLIGIPVGFVMSLIVGGIENNRVLTADSGQSTIVQIIVLLAYFVYDAVMLTTYGQTVGKKLMRIRVAMLSDGSIPSGQAGWFRAGTYALPQLVPCCGFVFWLINVLWCTWDRPYHQCLHDKVARTVVVAAH
ncbi:RDD family protein [Streptomyces sp. TP-A0874]|uniref:RDD family protein n=1 Tax=Streptomyces sp. TP-A0874 TaxID=549819 RepID=UPI000852D839|nr:RDD family protein [Streptomyces sp. TP-A0874]